MMAPVAYCARASGHLPLFAQKVSLGWGLAAEILLVGRERGPEVLVGFRPALRTGTNHVAPCALDRAPNRRPHIAAKVEPAPIHQGTQMEPALWLKLVRSHERRGRETHGCHQKPRYA
jgi:hypothetical protein